MKIASVTKIVTAVTKIVTAKKCKKLKIILDIVKKLGIIIALT